MANQALTREQQQFMESQAAKILDLLVKIAPIPQSAKEGYRISRETEKALDMTVKTVDTALLSSSDDNMNRLATISQRLSNELSSLNRQNEMWWLEASGANLFSKVDSTEALKKLERHHGHLLALREACVGLKLLAAALFGQGASNVKGLARKYIFQALSRSMAS